MCFAVFTCVRNAAYWMLLMTRRQVVVMWGWVQYVMDMRASIGFSIFMRRLWRPIEGINEWIGLLLDVWHHLLALILHGHGWRSSPLQTRVRLIAKPAHRKRSDQWDWVCVCGKNETRRIRALRVNRSRIPLTYDMNAWCSLVHMFKCVQCSFKYAVPQIGQLLVSVAPANKRTLAANACSTQVKVILCHRIIDVMRKHRI